jgi:hypothetical protein
MTSIRMVLTLVFGWSLLRTGSFLLRRHSMDLLLLRSAGLEWCFWLLVPAIGVCLVVGLIYLWRPSRTGYRFAVSAIGLNVLETTVAAFVAASNPIAAQEAFVASRMERGLPVYDAAIHTMSNPRSHLVLLAFSVFLAGIWLALLYLLGSHRNQRPLRPIERDATKAANGSPMPVVPKFAMSPAPESLKWKDADEFRQNTTERGASLAVSESLRLFPLCSAV